MRVGRLQVVVQVFSVTPAVAVSSPAATIFFCREPNSLAHHSTTFNTDFFITLEAAVLLASELDASHDVLDIFLTFSHYLLQTINLSSSSTAVAHELQAVYFIRVYIHNTRPLCLSTGLTGLRGPQHTMPLPKYISRYHQPTSSKFHLQTFPESYHHPRTTRPLRIPSPYLSVSTTLLCLPMFPYWQLSATRLS